MNKPTEKRFEKQIEEFLLSINYKKTSAENFNKNLCIIPDLFFNFIKETQNKKLINIQDQLFESTNSKILERVDEQIEKYGLINFLKHGFKIRDTHFEVFIKKPKSLNNEDHVKEYKKNIFTVVRQLKYKVGTEQSVDTVIFLNGIPLITIELKNQLTNQNIEDAIKQYKNDRDPRDKLFSFKRCLVHFGVDNDQVVMTTKLAGNKTYFLPFNKNITNPTTNGYKSEYLWKEILAQDNLIDIIERFAHIANESFYEFNKNDNKVVKKEKEVLIFPRYHQLEVINLIEKQLKIEGVGKNFLIQHTTGSGKSYEIGWLAHLLSSFYRNPNDLKKLFDTVIVVTDRTVLDEQLRNTIESLEETSGVVNSVTEDSKQLKKYLEDDKSIIISTIQKFPVISKTISQKKNKNFAVIFDEVHSSQGGKSSQELRRSISDFIDKFTGEEKNFEDIILNEIKIRGNTNNVSFFGFTGTPKQETLELFGRKNELGGKEPFHIYSMKQSIHEGFTLDVLKNFIDYKRYFKLKELDEDIKISSIKSKSKIFNFVDDQDITINTKIDIILDHFINKAQKEIDNQARGMIVVSSRPHCVKYFKIINQKLNDLKQNFRCIVGFSEFEEENEKYNERTLNMEVGMHESIPIGFKNPKFRLLVVSNKFQTGFDEPLLQSMYIDKSMSDIQCVQTLSRANRVTPGKVRAFILDFKNTREKVFSSFQKFYKGVYLNQEADPNQLHDLLTEIDSYKIINKESVIEFCKIYLKKNRIDEELQPFLNISADKWNKLSNEEKITFKSLIKKFIDFYDLIIQVINYQYAEHYQYYMFFENLITKLNLKSGETKDISEYLRLMSLKIVGGSLSNEKLKDEDSELDNINIETGTVIQENFLNLKELIVEMNNVYGSELSENDILKIENMMETKVIDQKLKDIVLAKNTEQDSKKIIHDRLYKLIIQTYDKDFEFYKKFDKNPKILKGVTDIVYKNIVNSINKS